MEPLSVVEAATWSREKESNNCFQCDQCTKTYRYIAHFKAHIEKNMTANRNQGLNVTNAQINIYTKDHWINTRLTLTLNLNVPHAILDH